MTNEEVVEKLTYYKGLYDSKYWNAGCVHNDFPSYANSYGPVNNVLNKDYWGVTTNNIRNDNSYNGATQCYGFSLFLARVLFGKKLHYWMVENAKDKSSLGDGWYIYNTRSSINEKKLEPGDIVRTSTHSAVVWSNNDGRVKVAECWGSYNSKLYWGDFNGGSGNNYREDSIKNIAKYIIKAPKTPKEIKMKVTFKMNGGRGLDVERTVTYGKPYGNMPTPTRSGYTFVGWWPEKNTDSMQYTSEKVVSVKYDHHLYAHWAKKYILYNAVCGKPVIIGNGQLTGITSRQRLKLGISRHAAKWYISNLSGNQSMKCTLNADYRLSSVGNNQCYVAKPTGDYKESIVRLECGAHDHYRIKNVKTNKYLTVANDSNGTQVYWASSSPSSYWQKWYFRRTN